MTTPLLRTPLYSEHVAAGARIVPFAGWEMPVQYAGVIGEVKAVREAMGVFDVSHMSRCSITGSGTFSSLDSVVSANWSAVPVGRAAYALTLTESGGILDDLMGYRLGAERWDIISNASRADVVEAQLRGSIHDATYTSRAETTMLAVQGPSSAAVLESLGLPVSGLGWRGVAELEGPLGVWWVARGGYTGSDGFEVVSAPEQGIWLWNQLLAAGVAPCGLGARDVLRLEAGLPLYGHELREEWTPAESGVGFAFKADKGNFLGRDAALRTPERRIVALRMEGKAIPREGYPVAVGDNVIGEVTSGTLSPTVGAGIALASVTVPLEVGKELAVVVRGTPQPARIVKRPFVAFAGR